MEETLNLPPFPPLEWDDYCWTGDIVLGAWAASGESVMLNVATPDDEPASPSPAQAAACRHLQDHQETTRDAILEAVFAKYAEMQEQYGYKGEDAKALMPDIERPEQLRALLTLFSVHLFTAAKDGVAYVGFLFGCTWDEEHGAGAMTHAGRVVEVGGADTAVLEWIATADAEQRA